MTISEVREKYISFFEGKDHHVIPSASLLPINDPTTLFVGSGMQPLLPYLLGKRHPKGRRLVNSQRSFRAEDIDEVGDNRHTTFFEMLGNWSFGDYFKRDQLAWFFEFLTEVLGMDPNRLYVTVFSGSERYNIQRDTESAQIWRGLFRSTGVKAEEIDLITSDAASVNGMQEARIFYYGVEKNWWSRSGVPESMPTGEPGGPDSEVFYDFQTPHDDSYGTKCHPNCDCGRFMEIGNSVFMQYIKKSDISFEELPQKNVDFGGGLERITAAVNDDPDIFKVDALDILIDKIEESTDRRYGEKEFQKSFRVIADHMRAATFMLESGVVPSNSEQGYVLRRLIRNSILHTDRLSISESVLTSLAGAVAEEYGLYRGDSENRSEQVNGVIIEEEKRFRTTLAKGLREFGKLSESDISGHDAFVLFTTYGFPVEITMDMARGKGVSVDEIGFKREMGMHREKSRSSSRLKFKGGLADTGEMSVKYHTATHLLYKALTDVLGSHVYQKGSNITSERLRFDFTHDRKVTSNEIEMVEEIVNKKIEEALVVSFEDMSADDAERSGALGHFGEKYGDTVRVYKIGEGDHAYSFEYCGGPHVRNTNTLGTFKIVKEEGVASGVRRIKAVLE
jgi:alanyl-tRNA synthetase